MLNRTIAALGALSTSNSGSTAPSFVSPEQFHLSQHLLSSSRPFLADHDQWFGAGAAGRGPPPGKAAKLENKFAQAGDVEEDDVTAPTKLEFAAPARSRSTSKTPDVPDESEAKFKLSAESHPSSTTTPSPSASASSAAKNSFVTSWLAQLPGSGTVKAEIAYGLAEISSAERFGRILAVFAMVFHGTSYLYIKGLKAEEHRQMQMGTHPFLYYEPFLIQIYFYLGVLLASNISWLYLSGGGAQADALGFAGRAPTTTRPPSRRLAMTTSSNVDAAMGDDVDALHPVVGVISFLTKNLKLHAARSVHAVDPEIFTSATSTSFLQDEAYGSGSSAGAGGGAGTHYLLANNSASSSWSDMFLHHDGNLSGFLAAICVASAFTTVEYIGVPLSSAIVTLTAVLGSFFVGFHLFAVQIWSSNMAFIGLTLVTLGLFGVCMTREIGRYLACSEERSPLLQVFELDAIWEVNHSARKRIVGILFAVVGGFSGALMFVPFENGVADIDAAGGSFAKHDLVFGGGAAGGGLDSSVDTSPYSTTSGSSSYQHHRTKAATLSHLFRFLPSFALGAAVTGWVTSLVYYATHRDARAIAWKKHPDAFESFCAVIAGLVWLISVFFTLTAMSYTGYVIASVFFHSWMLVYSGWSLLLFNEIRGKSHAVYSFAQLLCVVGFMVLCLSMNK
mmetsp:Transcript_16393/g.40491  ORF Transcript_16393/g.40491 Transcript_16393/m.40491 type:complete len:676 (-) Transcript_16393:1103-3130(-)|eukprot:g5964.t1